MSGNRKANYKPISRSRQSQLQDTNRALVVIGVFVAMWYLILLGLAATALIILLKVAF